MRSKAYFNRVVSFILTISTIGHANEQTDWENYYQNTINISHPRKTALLADKYFQCEGKEGLKAVDLGAGTGRDTLFLLSHGWHVFAIDAEKLSIDIILSRVDPSFLQNLETRVMSFSEMMLPNELDLINASYSLPFCKPKDFPRCWKIIVDQLAIGGRFAGHFFGEKDEWARDPNLTIHSYEEMLKLFEEQFIIEFLRIEEGIIPCKSGEMKHGHVYHVVAKKVK